MLDADCRYDCCSNLSAASCVAEFHLLIGSPPPPAAAAAAAAADCVLLPRLTVDRSLFVYRAGGHVGQVTCRVTSPACRR